jgi:hypothetical protein
LNESYKGTIHVVSYPNIPYVHIISWVNYKEIKFRWASKSSSWDLANSRAVLARSDCCILKGISYETYRIGWLIRGGKILLSQVHRTPQSIIDMFSILYLTWWRVIFICAYSCVWFIIYDDFMSNFSNNYISSHDLNFIVLVTLHMSMKDRNRLIILFSFPLIGVIYSGGPDPPSARTMTAG